MEELKMIIAIGLVSSLMSSLFVLVGVNFLLKRSEKKRKENLVSGINKAILKEKSLSTKKASVVAGQKESSSTSFTSLALGLDKELILKRIEEATLSEEKKRLAQERLLEKKRLNSAKDDD